MTHRRLVALAYLLLPLVLLLPVFHFPLAGQPGADARDMRLVGYNELQARSAYQPVIHHQGDRWVAYIGHHGGLQPNPLTGTPENNGTSIVDVTDPRRPRYL